VIGAFGTLRDGRAVELVKLGTEQGLQAEILTYGGILRRLSLPAKRGRCELVLSLPDLAHYENDSAFLGQLIGRFGNRIAGAGFELDGHRYRLSPNEGANHLHGGAVGFGRCLWRLLDLQSAPVPALRLGLHSPAGDQGYPGNLEVTATYTLLDDELRLEFKARSDAATPLNLTFHPYFNLAGEPNRPVEEMLLRIPGEQFLPVGAGLIPTGELIPVAGTPMDFRASRAIGRPDVGTDAQLAAGAGYDHCWVLDAERDCDAGLMSPCSGVSMSVHSSLPGLQFYAGQSLPRQHPGLNGICLEPQGFPDAVNRPGFPAAILRAGECRVVSIHYRFHT
jgi:aldose 1-epimerase